MKHEFPSEKHMCIVNNQPCNFFVAREKDQKSVFIAAPSRSLKELRQEIEKMIEAEGYLHYFAPDKREGLNKISLCQKICEPMLKASIVVVVGDWIGNKGNVNIAFEYGLATAMGCETIPVEIERNRKGAFDFLPLEKIIIDRNWRKDPEKLREFRAKFLNSFRKSKDRVEFLEMTREMPPKLKQGIIDLIDSYEGSSTDDEKESCLVMLEKHCHQVSQSGYGKPWKEESLVQWVVSTTKRYAKEGFVDNSLGMTFFGMLITTVDENLSDSGSPILNDTEFSSAIKKIALAAKAPLYARNSAVDCIVQMVTESDRIDMLEVLFQIARDVTQTNDIFDTLPQKMRMCGLKMSWKGTVGHFMGLLKEMSKETDPELVRRYEKIRQTMKTK